MLNITNLTTLTNDQIFEAIQELREMKFGITVGTLGDSDFSIYLIYWPKPHLELEKYEGPISEIVIKALVLGRTLQAMDREFGLNGSLP